jgi:hypothetical protein
MRYDGTAKLQRKLLYAVVQAWMISSAAALVGTIQVEHARGGELMDCEPQRVRDDGRHWAYRILDGRQCWYPGQAGKPKSELRWKETPSVTHWNSLTSTQGLPRQLGPSWWNRPKSPQAAPSRPSTPRLLHRSPTTSLR